MRDSLLHRILPLFACLALLALFRFVDLGVTLSAPEGATVALGLLLIGAYVGGQATAAIGLPRITGYLLAGLVLGPHVSTLLTKEMLVGGKAVEQLAVALIALTAGGEIRLDWVRKNIRRLVAITATELVFVAVGVMAVVFLAREWFPFMPNDNLVEAGVIAMVFGAIAVANSPTVTIAVISETRSDGPLSRTVLGVTIVKDLCVIVFFAVALAVARNVLGAGGDTSLGLTLAREIGGSIAAGIAFGMAIAWGVHHLPREVPAMVLLACLGISETASALHLEALLVALTAGIWVENFSPVDGHKLIEGIERVALPVYALFFAAAGAKVNLGVLAEMWPLALMLIVARAACVWAGTHVGARISKAEPMVVRYAWLGFISQAGVTLALSSLVARAFPTWGLQIQILIVAMIAVHELIGPLGFQYALKRAGEVGRSALADEAPALPSDSYEIVPRPGESG